ncbi:nuclear transport factor 2 family protein [Agrobacterium tumefaciens]|uniref:nuclear transport factor 2 family protein n=1 Tax=Agrobacterium tumefaciens TaxID=358 RepID=UPI0015735D76|nr:nuclear transport factor 2 family protein [Agrobacterium tumefaciens]NTE56441.1 nuclear transport factor 2 family protein [Agrobacterium tumefaciens]NTE74409.1 nuclear transport factor 2 family protein [Agrobacterium tumefaciens]
MSTANAGASLDDTDTIALNEWHRIITHRDWRTLPDLLTDDVTYHNPGQLEPYRGKDALVGILQLVFSIFEDFQYHRRFHGPEGHVLEFSARVGDSPIFGIDIVRFDEAGKMVDLVVMLRPADSVAKLGQEVARRIAAAGAAKSQS